MNLLADKDLRFLVDYFWKLIFVRMCRIHGRPWTMGHALRGSSAVPVQMKCPPFQFIAIAQFFCLPTTFQALRFPAQPRHSKK